MQIYTTVALKPNFMSSLLLCTCCITLNMHIFKSLLKSKIFIVKLPKDSLLIFLVWNFVFATLYHFKAVQNDISSKTVPSNCITLYIIIKIFIIKIETYFLLYIWSKMSISFLNVMLKLSKTMNNEHFNETLISFIPPYIFSRSGISNIFNETIVELDIFLIFHETIVEWNIS